MPTDIVITPATLGGCRKTVSLLKLGFQTRQKVATRRLESCWKTIDKTQKQSPNNTTRNSGRDPATTPPNHSRRSRRWCTHHPRPLTLHHPRHSPHRSLNGKTPHQQYTARAKATPQTTKLNPFFPEIGILLNYYNYLVGVPIKKESLINLFSRELFYLIYVFNEIFIMKLFLVC